MKTRFMRIRFYCLYFAVGLVWMGGATASGQNVSCLGQLVPGERVLILSAPPDSIVGELHVKRSDRVEKGDVLAVLRDQPTQAAKLELALQKLESARIEFHRIQAGERPEAIAAQESLIAAHRAEADLAELRRGRFAQLLKEAYLEQDRYDGQVAELAVLQARIRHEESVLEGMQSGRKEDVAQADLGVKMAEAEVAAARSDLELQTLRAPCAGEIVEVHAWPGESTGANGALVSLAETDRMRVLAEVHENDLSRVTIGQRARIRGAALPFEFEGTVVEIEHVFADSRMFALVPEVYVDRRIMMVRIQPDDPAKLAPYCQAHVTILMEAP